MKIAIITIGHEGSSLPLAKSLAQNGHIVDLYFDLRFGRRQLVEGTDLQLHSLRGLVGEVPGPMIQSLKTWIGTAPLTFKYINTVGEAKSKPLLTPFFSYIRNIQIKHICKCLDFQNYDAIYLIGRYLGTDDIILYAKYLTTKIYVGLHEVCNHLCPDFYEPSPLLKFLFSRNIPIVVYSHKTYEDLKNYRECNIANVTLIHFGIFDTYPICNVKSTLLLPEKYILFFGYIQPYKGLSILVEAMEMMQNFPSNWNIVIAGNGKDDSLSRIANNNRFILLNRFLSNSELVELLSKSTAVVCPHISMSQSGIPQTAFAFGVPVITSDLEGFKEVVVNGENGLLFQNGSPESLCCCIKKIVNQPKVLDFLKEGARNFNQLHHDFSWNHIALKYEELFNEVVSKNTI